MEHKSFHVRAQLRRKGGNQWYRDKSIRETHTLCGAPVTEWDVRNKVRSVVTGHPSGYELCEKCDRLVEIARGSKLPRVTFEDAFPDYAKST